jgi:hypothetical protein
LRLVFIPVAYAFRTSTLLHCYATFDFPRLGHQPSTIRLLWNSLGQLALLLSLIRWFFALHTLRRWISMLFELTLDCDDFSYCSSTSTGGQCLLASSPPCLRAPGALSFSL